MKIVQVLAIVAGVEAAVTEGYPCVTAADCTVSNSDCCNAYRSGGENRKLCFSPGTTAIGNVAPSNYYTKACAVAVDSAASTAVTAIVSVLSVAYMT